VLASEIDADWFIHHDADEIRLAPPQHRTLRDGIAAADNASANAVNFDEFVFVPTHAGESFEGRDYVAEMRAYYFFEPTPLHRVNAWKKSCAEIDLVSSGGHSVAFNGRVVFDENFILRHYIVLSERHCIRKYGAERVYSQWETAGRGWHGWRGRFRDTMVRLPEREEMKSLDQFAGWDRSSPQRTHIFVREELSGSGC
jgi:hypothetical protein